MFCLLSNPIAKWDIRSCKEAWCEEHFSGIVTHPQIVAGASMKRVNKAGLSLFLSSLFTSSSSGPPHYSHHNMRIVYPLIYFLQLSQLFKTPTPCQTVWCYRFSHEQHKSISPPTLCQSRKLCLNLLQRKNALPPLSKYIPVLVLGWFLFCLFFGGGLAVFHSILCFYIVAWFRKYSPNIKYFCDDFIFFLKFNSRMRSHCLSLHFILFFL